MGLVGCEIVEVVAYGGGFGLFYGLWLMMTMGCGWFY